jgi:hypothetical protein
MRERSARASVSGDGNDTEPSGFLREPVAVYAEVTPVTVDMADGKIRVLDITWPALQRCATVAPALRSW